MRHLSAAALAALAGTLTPQAPAQAHGAPDYPIARVYNCFSTPSLPACQAAIAFGGPQAIYDWNGVNQGGAYGNHQAVVPDHQLCAGGQEKFKGFDLPRADWVATPYSPGADGKYEYRYNATAPHRTLNWKFYLTRDGFDASARAMKWSDLDLVAELGPDQMQTVGKTYTMKLSLPRRTGKQVLYSVWQRSDSGEAFYACSDVDFGGTGATPPAIASALKQIAQVSAAQDLPAGAQITLRVFDKQGGDRDKIVTTLNSPTAKAAWLARIAQQVNASSPDVKMGALQGGTVVVPANITVMDVYAVQATSGVSAVLEFKLPSTQPVATPPQPPAGVAKTPVQQPISSSDTWVEGQTYRVGDVVTRKDRRYRCLQAHTAYKGAGWSPDAVGSINVLWQPL
ncbi:hypothetical protein ABE85_05550 [Mitsuaria sp. 7]|nr:hypothetical protein ABE85_05550 [Mitsuaria sp. 7]